MSIKCDELRDRFAKPHHLGKIVDELNLPDEMAGGGGIKSSGRDMLAFLSYAMGVKNSDLRDSFCLTQIPNHEISKMSSIGLGWSIINNGKKNIIGHNGGTDGFASFIGFDSDSHKGVVLLTNSQELVDKIGLDILEFNVEKLANSEKK